MKGKLFRRFEEGFAGIGGHFYNIWFPGDTFESSLLLIRSSDLVLEIDDFKPPPEAKRFSDGSASWIEPYEFNHSPDLDDRINGDINE